jgi:hypothetical protein
MKRAYLVSLAVQAVLLALPAVGNAQAIGKAMGNLRWGMSDTEVQRVAKTRLTDQYGEKIKKAKGSTKAGLERELATKQKAIASSHVFEFSGKSSRWDRTPIAGEFGYGTGESMLVLNDGESENYYFFLDGQLWKWVKLYPSSQFGGKNFSKFSAAIQGKFGKGYKKESELNGSSKKLTFLEFLDRQSRLRAVDRTSDANSYALVFEDMATVRQIASLRPQTKKTPARLATADDEAEEEVVTKKPEKGEKQRRSVFGDEEKEETQESYEARKNDMMAKKREQQRKAYEREQEIKKGKELDSLQGVDDDDPLAGMN